MTIAYLVGLLSAILTLAITLAMLVTFRKERPVGRLAPLASIVLSLVILLIFSALSGSRLRPGLSLLILGLGIAVGAIRGLATKLRYREGRVIRRHSPLFLLGWGVSLALAQGVTLLDSTVLASAGLIPLVLTTGTQIGIDSNIYIRSLLMRPSNALYSESLRRRRSAPPNSRRDRQQPTSRSASSHTPWWLWAAAGCGAIFLILIGGITLVIIILALQP